MAKFTDEEMFMVFQMAADKANYAGNVHGGLGHWDKVYKVAESIRAKAYNDIKHLFEEDGQ